MAIILNYYPANKDLLSYIALLLLLTYIEYAILISISLLNNIKAYHNNPTSKLY